MSSYFRYGVVAALATACHWALAQTVVPPTVTVTRIAPQLVAFAGSPSNFQNLVNGLTQGTQVQLVTQLPDGFTQIVSFTPAAALPPTQAAQVLETARQQLIGLGIANPTAEQIATTLMGGVVPTALGGAQVGGVLTPQTTPSPAAQAQSNAAIGSTAALGSGLGASTGAAASTTTPSTVIPPVNVQIFPNTQANTTTTDSAPRVNTSDSLTAPGAVSRSPVPATPGAPGPSIVTNPTAPGERSSAIAPAPAVPSVTPPIATPLPATTPAQSANTSSGFGAIRR